MDKEIIIYGKAGCPFTDKALSAFGEKAKYVDVGADSLKMQEMLNVTGGIRKVPVIVDEGKVTIGYGGT
jgi:glutaredoxin 3